MKKKNMDNNIYHFKCYYLLIKISSSILIILVIFYSIYFENIFKKNYNLRNNENFILILDIEGIISILNIIQTIIFGIFGYLKIKYYFIILFLIFTLCAFISNITAILIIYFYYSSRVNLMFYILSIIKEVFYLTNIIFVSIILKTIKTLTNEKIILKTDNLSEKIFKALSEQQQKLLNDKNENLVDFSNINIRSEDFSLTNSLEKSN